MSFDRFIPSRPNFENDYSSYQLMEAEKIANRYNNDCSCLHSVPSLLQRRIGAALFKIDIADNQPILNFHRRKPPVEWKQIKPRQPLPSLRFNKIGVYRGKNIHADAYNTLFSSSARFAAIPASSKVYLYNFLTKKFNALFSTPDDDVKSTHWLTEQLLAYGTASRKW